MSAFMTTKTHIGILAAYYADSGYSPGEFERVYTETFDEFNESNALSMKARYGEELEVNMHSGAIPPYFSMSRKAKQFVSIWGQAGILKACDCFEYQSCEYAEWQQSMARKRIDAIRAEAIRQLPGYDAAPWGIHDPSQDETTTTTDRL